MFHSARRFHALRFATAVASLAAVALASCAEEQPPINRVQADVLEKSFFVGKDLLSPHDDPEFWAQSTLVDVGYGASQNGLFTSTYAQPLSRVKWVVQENMLVARLTYERVDSSDGKGAGPSSTDGQVVAAYRIVSHFDIQREYNPSTGEQTNVIVENTWDRPWYEREYMRVDWSKNLNTDAYELDTLAQLGVYGSIVYTPLAYYVNDPTHPDAPVFDLESGYFDITSKAFAKPGLVDLRHLGWGIDSFPACWLTPDVFNGAGPGANCNPVELTIRHSFRQVVDNDYEPADWDGHRFKAYGAFTTERFGYARNYGMSDTKWHRFINRYNLWERSHYYANPEKRTGAVACFTPETTPAGADPNRDLDGDGTADECAQVGRGSRCNTFDQKCTLPYRDREARPVVWYYAEGSDPEYFEPTDWAAHEWDVALRGAVLTARYAECRRVGGGESCRALYPVYDGQMDDHHDAVALAREVDDCRNGKAYAGRKCEEVADEVGQARGYSAGVIAVAKLPEMGVLCHSPVQHDDHELCGSPRLPKGVTAEQCFHAGNSGDLAETCRKATRARLGDLRYHQLVVVGTPQTPSPWGIMVDSHDPLTGEKVAASSNVWSHVTDLWSQSVIDLARYVKGELSTADVTEGTYVHDWAQASSAAAGGGASGRMTAAQRDERLADFLGLNAAELANAKVRAKSFEPQLQERLAALDAKIADVRADAFAPSSTRPVYEARRIRAQGSDVEAALTTRAMQQLGGISGNESSEDIFNRASPLRAGNVAMMLDLDKRRQNALAERGACMLNEAPAPVAIAAFADVLEEKFGKFNPDEPKDVQLARAERMRRWLAFRAHASVMAHEMGHSIGLRHNFVSSSDAFSFRPQYWQLRTNDGATTALCQDLVADGANCIGPRWFDPPTDQEKDNLIWLFQHSSTMEYPGEATQNLLGLGAYDFAATRMFYGDTVAVHADSSYLSDTLRGSGSVAKMDQFGGLLGWQYQWGGPNSNIHYSELQRRYGLIQQCAEVDPAAFKPANWDEALHGPWHPLVDGLIVSVNGKHTRCRQQPVDYVNWDDMRPGGGKQAAADASGRTRVPYGFATDRWADLGNAAVYRHDNGADTYEVFDFLISQQETMHIFDNFRRHRQGFSIRGAAGRSLGRYNEKLRDGAKGIGLLVNIYKDFALQNGYDFETLWPALVSMNLSDNILASSIVFDHFARQLQRPQSGEHFVDTNHVLRSTDDYYGSPGSDILLIPNGATGHFGNVSFGGRPLENALADDRGEYDSEYTLWAGSYYDKAYTAMLLTESVDNFISSSRNDFLDARFRSVSMADVFPEGYRRWLANNLTNDATINGPRVAAGADLSPLADAAGYPAGGIGWTSWWPAEGPQSCFPQSGSLSCTDDPAYSVVLDPQVGWEQQKFLIAWTLQYLPENEQQHWLNMLGIWEIGADTDPGFEQRIELHDPNGRIYVAKTFGKEQIFGRTVQRGVAARILEYANELMAKAYEVAPGDDLDGDGQPDWWLPVRDTSGKVKVKWDPTLSSITENGGVAPNGRPGCNALENDACTCTANRACVELSRYTEVPFFLRQAMRAYGLALPSMRGIYN